MRSTLCLLTISFLFSGIAVAQETNFAAGPQYLIPGSASPLFLHSIATPTLSLQNVPVPPAIAFENGTGLPASPEPAAPLPLNLFSIYYGYPAPGESLALSANTPSEPVFQYGENPIEISSSPLPANLPSSIVNIGVTAVVDPETLHESGHGLSVAEAAAFWKAHRALASHVYTNADLTRLHGG